MMQLSCMLFRAYNTIGKDISMHEPQCQYRCNFHYFHVVSCYSVYKYSAEETVLCTLQIYAVLAHVVVFLEGPSNMCSVHFLLFFFNSGEVEQACKQGARFFLNIKCVLFKNWKDKGLRLLITGQLMNTSFSVHVLLLWFWAGGGLGSFWGFTTRYQISHLSCICPASACLFLCECFRTTKQTAWNHECERWRRRTINSLHGLQFEMTCLFVTFLSSKSCIAIFYLQWRTKSLALVPCMDLAWTKNNI